MNPENEEKLGILKISDDVIVACAVNATLKTKGIAELSGGFTDNLSKNILGKDPQGKGVKISQNEEGITLDIFVMVNYEEKIPAVAWDVQENVKKEVEQMTELTVKAVNIHVQGVRFPEEEKIHD